VVRGGSWHEVPSHCRSAVRLKFKANERDDYVGFRVALSQPKDN
jgi:formylglycine-generating enzyme required for sulfatase activity